MKRLILICVMISTLKPAYGIEEDKILHASVSFVATYGLYTMLGYMMFRDRNNPVHNSKRKWVLIPAVAFTALAGLGKELGDAGPSGRIDGGDMLANSIGYGSATGLVFMLDW